MDCTVEWGETRVRKSNILGNVQETRTHHSDAKDENEEQRGQTDDNDSNEPLWDEVSILLHHHHLGSLSHHWE